MNIAQISAAKYSLVFQQPYKTVLRPSVSIPLGARGAVCATKQPRAQKRHPITSGSGSMPHLLITSQITNHRLICCAFDRLTPHRPGPTGTINLFIYSSPHVPLMMSDLRVHSSPPLRDCVQMSKRVPQIIKETIETLQ